MYNSFFWSFNEFYQNKMKYSDFPYPCDKSAWCAYITKSNVFDMQLQTKIVLF